MAKMATKTRKHYSKQEAKEQKEIDKQSAALDGDNLEEVRKKRPIHHPKGAIVYFLSLAIL